MPAKAELEVRAIRRTGYPKGGKRKASEAEEKACSDSGWELETHGHRERGLRGLAAMEGGFERGAPRCRQGGFVQAMAEARNQLHVDDLAGLIDRELHSNLAFDASRQRIFGVTRLDHQDGFWLGRRLVAAVARQRSGNRRRLAQHLLDRTFLCAPAARGGERNAGALDAAGQRDAEVRERIECGGSIGGLGRGLCLRGHRSCTVTERAGRLDWIGWSG